jgi:hypothetical protein
MEMEKLNPGAVFDSINTIQIAASNEGYNSLSPKNIDQIMYFIFRGVAVENSNDTVKWCQINDLQQLRTIQKNCRILECFYKNMKTSGFKNFIEAENELLRNNKKNILKAEAFEKIKSGWKIFVVFQEIDEYKIIPIKKIPKNPRFIISYWI